MSVLSARVERRCAASRQRRCDDRAQISLKDAGPPTVWQVDGAVSPRNWASIGLAGARFRAVFDRRVGSGLDRLLTTQDQRTKSATAPRGRGELPLCLRQKFPLRLGEKPAPFARQLVAGTDDALRRKSSAARAELW